MVFKFKHFLTALKHFYCTTYRQYGGTAVLSLSFWLSPQLLYESIIKTKETSKTDRYWIKKTVLDLIQDADDMYLQGQYMDVYETLNRIKFNSNPEVQWRICRALFKMSLDENFDSGVRREMILEAYTLINLAISLEKNNPNVYKWMAVITDAKCGYDGLVTKIRAYEQVKGYMEKALELNPNDMVILYMLGKWCYEMSRLTWFQRLIAAVLYENPPECTYTEAYSYLSRSAELQKTSYYIPTYYLLGKTCIRLKQFFRARFYLQTAISLPARSSYERRCVKKSKLLLSQLEKYDLDRDCILYDCPFSAQHV